jgi:hypothetical protein
LSGIPSRRLPGRVQLVAGDDPARPGVELEL